jgi:hypothetical protein
MAALFMNNSAVDDVNNDVDGIARTLRQLGIEDIPLNDPDIRVICQLRLPQQRIAPEVVVDDAVIIHQSFGQRRSDESRTTRDEDRSVLNHDTLIYPFACRVLVSVPLTMFLPDNASNGAK